MSAIGFDETIPILRIFSVEKAKELYLDFLHVTLDWEHCFDDNLPLYMQISRGRLRLHLSEHYGDACPGSTIFVRMHGIDALHCELAARNYRYLKPGIEHAPWKARLLEVTDPFGNRIRFNEDDSTG